MSINDWMDFFNSIRSFTNRNWIVIAIIFCLLIIFFVVKWILGNYKKGKHNIKDNLKELWKDLKQLTGWKKAAVLGGVILCFISVFFVSYIINKPRPYQEIAILTDQNEVIYPIEVDIVKKIEVGNFTFFTFTMTEAYDDNVITYPVLFKWEKGKLAERISEGACPHFEVINKSVIYLDSTFIDYSHGQLYVARPDGKNERIMEEEIYDFSIANEYIYFTYCFDTVGVGLEGHALHRMDLNGYNIITVAYEISSPSLQGSHFDVRIEDGWAIYTNYKIKIDDQADGLEKVVLLDKTDEDWIYYTSNRLIKARPDGTGQVVLDGIDDFYYQIDKIEGKWIYYQKGEDKYKIDINGKNKVKIE